VSGRTPGTPLSPGSVPTIGTPDGPVSGRTFGTPMPQPSVPSASISGETVATMQPHAPAAAGVVTPPASREVYRWIDERGVVNLTDQLYAVPERYRALTRGHR